MGTVVAGVVAALDRGAANEGDQSLENTMVTLASSIAEGNSYTAAVLAFLDHSSVDLSLLLSAF
jgi:hypothetical protein